MQNGSFYHLPAGLPPKPSEAVLVGKGRATESEPCRLRRDEGFVVRSDDGKQSVRPTKSDGRRKFCGALPRTR